MLVYSGHIFVCDTKCDRVRVLDLDLNHKFDIINNYC